MTKLSIGISPCPNDTFIFDAMLNGKVDTGNLEFDLVLSDVEELNSSAQENKYDITKISYHAYAYVADEYILLNSGSALGYNNGPLLVTTDRFKISFADIRKIAIPGRYTTANLLMSIIYPDLAGKDEYLFSDIEDAVLEGKADAGLLIHENRFTYQEKGLYKIRDLGEAWMDITAMPIPLGGIAVKRSLGESIASGMQEILKKSVDYAWNNPDSSRSFIKENAVSMKDEVIDKHIKLYVNDFSSDLGDKGREAVFVLYDRAAAVKIIPEVRKDIFI